MEKTTCIQIDFERSSDDFYDFVDEQKDAPEELKIITGRHPKKEADEIMVTPARAKEIEDWCITAPGYFGGPKHAPHPILLHENYK